jgi:peroxiredoxin
MVATASTMLDLGTPAPAFDLADPAGRRHALADFDDAPALLVAFICNHCPYVKLIKSALAAFGRDYRGKGLAMVAISANDPGAFPADAPERMAEDAREFGYPFPYLFDEDQSVARAYGAVCTPEFFLFDRDRRLVYRGQFDGARPNNGIEPTGADLRAAVDAVLAGRPVAADQKPSVGCSIKWKPGNAPD